MNKWYTLPVLDSKGFVRYIDHMGTDLDILEAARISYKSPSKGPEQDRKLLHYLWKNRHTSPFEMVKVKFNIRMPIFVLRQYIRHRMQNLNEMSGRYTELPSDFYIPTKWRKQDTKNKQGSVEDEEWKPLIIRGTGFDKEVKTPTEALIEHCDRSYQLYEEMLAAGIAREMARIVLPLNIYTEFYCCWDMNNLTHFMTLRDDSHAQSEIQEYAKAIKQMCTELFPITMEAFNRYKFVMVDTQEKK